MFRLGLGPAGRYCDGVSRRDFLQLGVAGIAAVGMPDLLRAKAASAQSPSTSRDVHALDEHGMVLCNPRDKEAAHRAAMGGIATADGADVTCPKCRELVFRRRRGGEQD